MEAEPLHDKDGNLLGYQQFDPKTAVKAIERIQKQLGYEAPAKHEVENNLHVELVVRIPSPVKPALQANHQSIDSQSTILEAKTA
jgi:hypothetical protein